MTTNVRQFNLELERFIGTQVPRLAIAAQKKVTLDALRGVVMKSPVKTGRFRGNWQVSVGSPVMGELATLDSSFGSPPSSGAEASALAVLSSLSAYGMSFVQNNLPYGLALESGSSKQAPLGMVALTLAELEKQMIEETAE